MYANPTSRAQYHCCLRVSEQPEARLTKGTLESASVQLTVRDVSRFLNVSESTVERWIKQRALPAQYVGGQYRFHRAELLEWATANGIKVSLELFDRLEASDEQAPSLAEALEMGGIFYHLQASNKERALRAVVGALPLPDGV